MYNTKYMFQDLGDYVFTIFIMHKLLTICTLKMIMLLHISATAKLLRQCRVFEMKLNSQISMQNQIEKIIINL